MQTIGNSEQEDFRFLATASSVLASSLDYQTTLTRVARLAVPRLADWCVVDVVDPSGSIQRLAAAHVNPLKEALAREVQRRYPSRAAGRARAGPDGPPSAASQEGAEAPQSDAVAESGVPKVLRTGVPELVPDITDEQLATAAHDAEHLRILRELGLRSAMVVPLAAHGRTLGAITFIAAESGRRFGPHDLALAEDLARRAALAADNARLYSELEKAQADAESQRARLHALFMQAPAIIVVTRGPQHIFELVNPLATQLLGKRDFIGKPAREAIPEVEHQGIFQLADRVYATGEPFVANEMLVRLDRRGDGSLEDGYFNFVLQPTSHAGGQIDGVMVHGVEVTEQVRARQHIEELERQKDEFLSAAAHDLKTPLTAIQGLAQMLSRRIAKSELGAAGGGENEELSRLIHGLAQINTTAKKMSTLINELLDVTRVHMDRPINLELRSTDLVALVRGVIAEQQRTTEQHRILLETAEPELIGQWDAFRLERMVSNILFNAVKFSPEGGEIGVTVEREGHQAVLTVKDEGVGIPEEDLPHIFERFYRGKNVAGRIAGTGIGLAGVRRIVEQHGGCISAESREGVGSTFTIRLPLSP